MDCYSFQKFIQDHCYGPFDKENIGKIIVIIKSELAKYYIKCNCDNLELFNKDTKRVRIILAANRNKSDYSHKLVRQSHGLIYQLAPNEKGQIVCSILAVPANDFNNNINHSEVELLLRQKKYIVRPLNDGTTITLYYDALDNIPGWRFSTKHGIDVEKLIWRGNKYGEVIMETLKEYENFSFEKLNKQCCYTFGFKHPAFHPFGQPAIWEPKYDQNGLNLEGVQNSKDEKWIKKAWLIYCFDKSKQAAPENVNIGIPWQIEIKQDSLQNSKSILGVIKSHCYDANKIYVNTGKAFLGYILRTVNENDTNSHSDILFESSLYKDIKMCIYDKPMITNIDFRRKFHQNFKNMNYVLLNSYLSPYKHDMFISFFPQYKQIYENLDIIIQKTVNMIYNSINTFEAQNGMHEFDTIEDQHAFILSAFFTELVRKYYQINLKEITFIPTKMSETLKCKQIEAKLQNDIHKMNKTTQQQSKKMIADKKIIKNIIQREIFIEKYMAVIFDSENQNKH